MKRIIKNILFSGFIAIIFVISIFLKDDISSQRVANKELLNKINKHIYGKSVKSIIPMNEKHCTASTLCIINKYYSTGYKINYSDATSECALVENNFLRVISISIGSCG